MSSLQLSVIIVNYNVKYFLEQCLCSVYKATAGLQAEIIVVDNASSDGSVEYLLSRFSEITIIDNPVNFGFAKACNQGLKQARGRCILFLNPDTILSEDCLAKCMNFLNSNPQYGACGVKMLDGSGRFLPESKRAFPSFEASFYKLSGLTKLFPHSGVFAKYYHGDQNPGEDRPVDVLSGAFLMTRKEVLDITGGFDERYFMYGEDIDLSYRIRKAGFLNHYLANVQIIHFKGESARKGSQDYIKMFYGAMNLFVKKHFSDRPRATIRLIQLSIWLRSGISSIRQSLLTGNKPIPETRFNTLIVGSAKETERAKAILAKQKTLRNISQLYPKDDWINQAATMKVDEIVFCQGMLSYKETIEIVTRLAKGGHVSFFGAGSDSIVGSSSSNSQGYVMA